MAIKQDYSVYMMSKAKYDKTLTSEWTLIEGRLKQISASKGSFHALCQL